MFFGQDREQLRSVYCEAWRRHRQGQALPPLQAQIVAVIACHPQYQSLLENREQALASEYLPGLGESNPFLHMGMHLALQEQISTDRPAGIRELYQRLAARHPDTHGLEHRLMECLAEMFWQAQRARSAPDETRYLDCIRRLTTGHE